MIKTIIFDYDGVLADSFSTVFKIYQTICRKLGKKVPPGIASFRKLYGKGSRDFYRNMNFTFHEIEAADTFFREEVGNHTFKLFPGVKTVLQALHKKYTLILISSTYQRVILQTLQEKGLQSYFKKIIGQERGLGPLRKETTLKSLLEKMNLDEDEVLLIGDRDVDYLEAKNAGIEQVILVEYGWGYDHQKIPRQKVLVKKPADLIRAVADAEKNAI